jgi:hypothetical protein
MFPSVTHKQVEQHSTMFVHGKIPLCPSTVRSRQHPGTWIRHCWWFFSCFLAESSLSL